MIVAPKVQIGDPVLWYPDGDRNQPAEPAWVTRVGQFNLCLNIIGPDTHNMKLRDGVPHISDPTCGSEHMRDAGGWDVSPLLRRLAALENICFETTTTCGK